MWEPFFSNRKVAAACLWLATLLVSPAWAHLMPAQQGTLNVVDNAVFAVLALPASLVPMADRNGDGRLSDAELRAQAPAIQRRVTDGLRLFNAAGTPQAEDGVVVLVNLLAEPEPESTHFLALLKFQFSVMPTALSLDTDLFGPAQAEQQLTLKVSRGDLIEAAVLRPDHATHRFFRSALQVFADYVETGVEHIVLGADHVLFLVTIIVAGAGWRYWLAVLTSFTLAHSITLTLGLLGWVKVNPAVVEPLIAASIVLMALLNLFDAFKGGRRPTPVRSVTRQAGVVFACGLLHGLGFASSMADMGLHGNYQLASLLGFNLGIELGQALCLAAVLAMLHVARVLPAYWSVIKGSTPNWPAPVWAQVAPVATGQVWVQRPVWASWLALAVGSWWVLERLG